MVYKHLDVVARGKGALESTRANLLNKAQVLRIRIEHSGVSAERGLVANFAHFEVLHLHLAHFNLGHCFPFAARLHALSNRHSNHLVNGCLLSGVTADHFTVIFDCGPAVAAVSGIGDEVRH